MPQNILLGAEGSMKLGDFGLTTGRRVGPVLQGRCGTRSYNAPERVSEESL